MMWNTKLMMIKFPVLTSMWKLRFFDFCSFYTKFGSIFSTTGVILGYIMTFLDLGYKK